MNPFFISTIIGTVLRLKRTCPKCKRDQVVSAGKRQESVSCKFCGTDIPPNK